MNRFAKLSRRSLLRFSMVGGGLLAGSSFVSACAPSVASPFTVNEPVAKSDFKPNLRIALKAVVATAPILSGAATTVWRYEGQVTEGERSAVQMLPDNYLGPVIRAKTGDRVQVTFTNQLPNGQPSIVHWHGLRLPEAMDGHPRYSIAPGQQYTYEFEVLNRAGTYWFHPHPHELTASQVNMGLAGVFIVSDAEEAALDLPSGELDLPLIIQDRSFDAGNQFVYDVAMPNGGMAGMMNGANGGHQHGMSGMMGQATTAPDAQNGMGAMMGGSMQGMMAGMMGFLGERILINGKPDATLSLSTRVYRLRLLNGSNSRIYKLAWSNGEPMTVIATDGGLLEAPAQRNYVMLAPGERVELWADFSQRNVGDQFTLDSLAFEGAESMAMGGNAPALGAPLTLLKVRIDRAAAETRKLPAKLSALQRLHLEDAANVNSPRQFRLQLRQMQWLINGRSYEMDKVADDEVVKFGSTEVWQFINEKNPAEMMDAMGMAHPIHIHGVQFNVIERQLPNDSVWEAGLNSVREGYIDEGWKDTFLMMPGEQVKVLARFSDYEGTYVFHCHNLEHENQGMMRNYQIRRG